MHSSTHAVHCIDPTCTSSNQARTRGTVTATSSGLGANVVTFSYGRNDGATASARTGPFSSADCPTRRTRAYGTFIGSVSLTAADTATPYAGAFINYSAGACSTAWTGYCTATDMTSATNFATAATSGTTITRSVSNVYLSDGPALRRGCPTGATSDGPYPCTSHGLVSRRRIKPGTACT